MSGIGFLRSRAMSHHDPFSPADSGGDTSPSGNDTESVPQDHLNSMRVPDLRALATSLGLDDTGSREKLIKRVRAHQSPPAPSDA